MKNLAFALSLLLVGAASHAQTYEIVLKTGRVLAAQIKSAKDELFELTTAGGEELTLLRTHLRAIEGDGPFADPPILWRRVPHAEVDRPAAFVRTSEHGDEQSLDVGVAAYEQADTGRRVYLVGAIHVAHADYYAALQSILDSMDLVLWEGVGAKEKPSQEAAERFDVLFRSQIMLRNMLNLDGQLQSVKYQRPFWQNCDVSVNDLQRELDARGLEMLPNEGLFRALFGTLFAIVDPESIPRNELIGRTYRGMVAPLMAQMSDPESIFGKLGAKGMKDVVIDYRNAHVLSELSRVLQEAGPERIAIFYGAGHLPGMDAALRDQLKLRFLGLHWVPAWRW